MTVVNGDLTLIKVHKDLVLPITYRCSRIIITTNTICNRSGRLNNNLVEDLWHLTTDTNNNMVDTCMEDQCPIRIGMIVDPVMADANPITINTTNRKVRIIKIGEGTVKVKMETGRTRICNIKAIIIIRNRSTSDRARTSEGSTVERSSNTIITIRTLDTNKTSKEPIMGNSILVRSTLRKTKGTFQNTT